MVRQSNSEIIIYEPSIDDISYDGLEIENIKSFKDRSDLIVANRLEDKLVDVKASFRDIFEEN